MRYRGWALAAFGAAALSVGAGSCGVTSGPTVTGTSLTIYISDPPGLSPQQQAVISAEEQAFSALKSQVSGFQLSLRPLHNAKLSAQARQAIDDSQAIAYLGEIVPGSSADSAGITNAEDLLQVSPTDNALELTQRTSAIPNAPSHYYESWSTYPHTFARVVPTSSREASVLVAEMQSLGVKTLQVQTDGSDYGRALRAAVAGFEPAASITSASSGADAVLYAGSSRAGAAAALNAAASADPRARLFVPSALADPSFLGTLSPAAQKQVFASTPGLPASLAAGAPKFPYPQALFGYAAMQAVIHVLARAGSKANDRSTVVKDFMRLRYTGSVLGSYAINQGDTSFDWFLIERLRSGRLVTVKALQGK